MHPDTFLVWFEHQFATCFEVRAAWPRAIYFGRSAWKDFNHHAAPKGDRNEPLGLVMFHGATVHLESELLGMRIICFEMPDGSFRHVTAPIFADSVA